MSDLRELLIAHILRMKETQPACIYWGQKEGRRDLFSNLTKGIEMSRESANRVLNRWRDGDIYPLHIITAALVATGDIDER